MADQLPPSERRIQNGPYQKFPQAGEKTQPLSTFLALRRKWALLQAFVKAEAPQCASHLDVVKGSATMAPA
jgi:hypothetical protein